MALVVANCIVIVPIIYSCTLLTRQRALVIKVVASSWATTTLAHRPTGHSKNSALKVLSLRQSFRFNKLMFYHLKTRRRVILYYKING